ncbi:hypothetical protein FRC16_007062 [Serendipita sp. 398]|nr:hypothetical protein FRC16_007062 [Serendipita sp. 398]
MIAASTRPTLKDIQSGSLENQNAIKFVLPNGELDTVKGPIQSIVLWILKFLCKKDLMLTSPYMAQMFA